MRPFPPGHASISASAEREHASISGSEERGMRLFRARFDPGMRPFQVGTIPACVHYGFGHPGLASIFDSATPAFRFARGMRQFPSRLNAGLRLLRSRLNRLASNSRRACVYFLAGQARACVYFGTGWHEHASIRDSDTPGMRLLHIRHASYSVRRTRGMRPFRIRPSRLASISAGACVYFRIG